MRKLGNRAISSMEYAILAAVVLTAVSVGAASMAGGMSSLFSRVTTMLGNFAA